MIENYLQILEDSLHKKKEVLKRIEAENKNQERILREEKVSFEAFETCVEQKTVLLEELNRLDQGFDQIYDRIKEQLLQGRENYKNQIVILQGLISELTEMSVSIQAQEARNKALVERFFAASRENINKGHQQARQAYNLYTKLSSGTVAPRFMDKKK